MKTIKCEECQKETILPEVAVRLSGRLRCPDGHSFEYDVKRFYTKTGELRVK